jgi:hypothetical protein
VAALTNFVAWRALCVANTCLPEPALVQIGCGKHGSGKIRRHSYRRSASPGLLPRCPLASATNDARAGSWNEMELVRESLSLGKRHGGKRVSASIAPGASRCRHSDDRAAAADSSNHDFTLTLWNPSPTLGISPQSFCNRRILRSYQRQICHRASLFGGRGPQYSSPPETILRRPAQLQRQEPSQSRCRIQILARANQIR